jgi:hypothetical protein
VRPAENHLCSVSDTAVGAFPTRLDDSTPTVTASAAHGAVAGDGELPRQGHRTDRRHRGLELLGAPLVLGQQLTLVGSAWPRLAAFHPASSVETFADQCFGLRVWGRLPSWRQSSSATSTSKCFAGAIDLGNGELIGIEVKSGGASLTKPQRTFDTRLNTSGQSAPTVCMYAGEYRVVGVYQWKRPVGSRRDDRQVCGRNVDSGSRSSSF